MPVIASESIFGAASARNRSISFRSTASYCLPLLSALAISSTRLRRISAILRRSCRACSPSPDGMRYSNPSSTARSSATPSGGDMPRFATSSARISRGENSLPAPRTAKKSSGRSFAAKADAAAGAGTSNRL